MSLRLISTEPDKSKSIRKTSDDLRRVRDLYRGVSEEYQTAQMVMSETTFFSQNASAMKSAGISLGLLATTPVPLIEVTAMQSKEALAGVRTASKEEMIKAATAKHPHLNWIKGQKGKFSPKNEHLADALGAIYAGVKSAQFLDAVAIFRAAKGF